MAISRRRTRRATLQYLYATWAYEHEVDADEFLGHFEEDVTLLDTAYFRQAKSYITDHLPRLLGIIQHFGPKFEVKTLPMVNLFILLLALFELLGDAFDDIPPHVAINEALELSKKYSDAPSKNFINGILNSVLQSLPTIKDGSLEIKPVTWDIF